MSLDKAEAKQIMDEVRAATDPILIAHGLKPRSLRASYDVGEIRLTIKGEIASGESSPKVVDWNRYAESFGLPLDALGKEITVQSGRTSRTTYRIDGLVPSRTKFPVAVTTIGTGKEMLLTVRGVKTGLGIKVEAWD